LQAQEERKVAELYAKADAEKREATEAEAAAKAAEMQAEEEGEEMIVSAEMYLASQQEQEKAAEHNLAEAETWAAEIRVSMQREVKAAEQCMRDEWQVQEEAIAANNSAAKIRLAEATARYHSANEYVSEQLAQAERDGEERLAQWEELAASRSSAGEEALAAEKMNVEQLKVLLASVEEAGETKLSEAKAISEEEAAAFEERMRQLEDEEATRFEVARNEAEAAQQLRGACQERKAAAEEEFAARLMEEHHAECVSKEGEIARSLQRNMREHFQKQVVVLDSACISQVKWARDQRDKHVLEAQKATLVAGMQADALRRLAESEERHSKEIKKLYDARLREALENVQEQVRLNYRGIQREKASVRRLQRSEQENFELLLSQLQTKKEEAYQASEVQEAEDQSWSTEMPIPELAGFWPHHDDISEDDSKDDSEPRLRVTSDDF